MTQARRPPGETRRLLLHNAWREILPVYPSKEITLVPTEGSNGPNSDYAASQPRCRQRSAHVLDNQPTQGDARFVQADTAMQDQLPAGPASQVNQKNQIYDHDHGVKPPPHSPSRCDLPSASRFELAGRGSRTRPPTARCRRANTRLLPGDYLRFARCRAGTGRRLSGGYGKATCRSERYR